MHETGRPEMQTFQTRNLRGSIKYLGLLVDKHGIKRDSEAIEAVLTWKARKIDTQLIEFIKGYADKIYPKQQLMQKKG